MRAFWWITLAYLTATAVAVGTGWILGDAHPVLVVAVADVAATCAVFAFSVGLNNSSVYDPYWSVAPPVIAGYWMVVGAGATARTVLVLVLVTAWAVRLTHNWARGWGGLDHEDWRYVDFRRRTGKAYWLVSFSGIHMFPTVMVWLGCLSLYPAMVVGAAPLGALDIAAAAVVAAAIVIEGVADNQMRRFVRNKEPGAIMNRGLWAYSRHPNYFGEILFWWGLYLFALAADPAYWWTAAGPAAITVMFVGVSIPLMERRSLERRPAFADHQRRVSALIPWFPR